MPWQLGTLTKGKIGQPWPAIVWDWFFWLFVAGVEMVRILKSPFLFVQCTSRRVRADISPWILVGIDNCASRFYMTLLVQFFLLLVTLARICLSFSWLLLGADACEPLAMRPDQYICTGRQPSSMTCSSPKVHCLEISPCDMWWSRVTLDTPPKTTIEPENWPLEKTIISRFHVEFPCEYH